MGNQAISNFCSCAENKAVEENQKIHLNTFDLENGKLAKWDNESKASKKIMFISENNDHSDKGALSDLDLKSLIEYENNKKSVKSTSKSNLSTRRVRQDLGEGNYYDGEMKNLKFHGNGKLQEDNFIYEGSFQNGKKHGKGSLESTCGKYKYNGDFNEDKKEGYGK